MRLNNCAIPDQHLTPSSLIWGVGWRCGLILVLTTLISLGLWWFGRGMGHHIAPLSVDIALLLGWVIWMRRSPWWLLLLLPLWIMDWVGYGITGVSLPDIATEGIHAYKTLPILAQILGMILPFMLLLVLGFMRRFQMPVPSIKISLIFLFLLGSITFAGRFESSIKWFRSGVIQAGKIAWSEPHLWAIRMGLLPSKAYYRPNLSLLDRLLDPHGNNLVIMVESLGLPTQATQRNQWLQTWQTTLQAARPCGVSVTHGVQATGRFTIQAEFRELCSMQITSFHPQPLPTDCFPRRAPLAIAYHNNDAHFYARHKVYSAMGFSRWHTLDTLPFLPHDPQTPFGAIRDKDMADWIVKQAHQHLGFHYWMTLDLHSPYTSERLSTEGGGGVGGISSGEAVYQALLTQQLTLFAKMVAQLPYYHVLLVGDHPPKFFNASDEHFQKGMTAYFDIPACSREGGQVTQFAQGL